MPTITNAPRFGFCLSGFLPTASLLVAIEIAERNSILAKRGFGLSKALAETLTCNPQSVLGVDFQPPRQRHDRKEQIPHLVEGLVGVGRGRQLTRLFGNGFGGLGG